MSTDADVLGPLPEPVAMIGNDGHPRHIGHVWGVSETRLYGPPRGLYRADQMRAERERCHALGVERCAAMLERAIDLGGLSDNHAWQAYTAELLTACAAMLRGPTAPAQAAGCAPGEG